MSILFYISIIIFMVSTILFILGVFVKGGGVLSGMIFPIVIASGFASFASFVDKSAGVTLTDEVNNKVANNDALQMFSEHPIEGIGLILAVGIFIYFDEKRKKRKLEKKD